MSLLSKDVLTRYSYLIMDVQDDYNIHYMRDFQGRTGSFKSDRESSPYKIVDGSHIKDNKFYLKLDHCDNDKPTILLIRLRDGTCFSKIEDNEHILYQGYFDFNSPIYEIVLSNASSTLELSGKIEKREPSRIPTNQYITNSDDNKLKWGDIQSLFKLLILHPISTTKLYYQNYRVFGDDFGAVEKLWDSIDAVIKSSEILNSKIILIPRGRSKTGNNNEIHYYRDESDKPLISTGIDNCNFDFIYYLAWLRKNNSNRGLKVKEILPEDDLSKIIGKLSYLSRYDYAWSSSVNEKSRQKAKYKAITESNRIFKEDLKFDYLPIATFNMEIVLNLHINPEAIFLIPLENIQYRI